LLLRRLEVTGESMVPALLPGDRVVVVGGLGPVLRPPIRVGAIVALIDPGDPDRIVIKRVVALEEGGVVVRGDNKAASTDSRHFGPVSPNALRGVVVYRYHPDDRKGWLELGTGPPPGTCS
jgi:nickel-type superoxide dismutase maturation protease